MTEPVDVICFRSVSAYIPTQRGAFISTESNSISDADSCKQASVDIVSNLPLDDAASG